MDEERNPSVRASCHLSPAARVGERVTGAVSRRRLSPNARASRGLTNPAQPFDRSPQLVRCHPCVTLRRVEVLMPEQLLDLAEVRPGTQEL